MSTTLAQLSATDLTAALHNRHLLIIGGTAGIGKALAVACLKRGAAVTIVGRRAPGPELSAAKYISKDLALMKNAAALADEVDVGAIDTIVFTNGILAAGTREETSEGLELDLAVSYLSRFVFARRIIERGIPLRSVGGSKPRIFVMGFPGFKNEATIDDFNSERKYSAWPAHMNTVVGNEAFVSYLNTAFKGAVNVYGLNPGLIKSEIREKYFGKGSWMGSVAETLIGWFTWSADAYAEQSLLHIVVSKELEDKPGALIDSKRVVLPPNEFLTKEGNSDRIITESQKLADRALAHTS